MRRPSIDLDDARELGIVVLLGVLVGSALGMLLGCFTLDAAGDS